MMKLKICALSLLMSASAFAGVTIQMNGYCGSNEFNKTFELSSDGQNHLAIVESNNVLIDADVAMDDESAVLTYCVKVNDEVVSEPVVKAVWDKEAILILTDSDNNEKIKVQVLATKN